MVVWRWLATVSVSQNDNYAQCESSAEKAINAAEGTAGGALFRAVNFIADAIKDDYPGVAIDTLAYQWSRPAPKITKPWPNGGLYPPCSSDVLRSIDEACFGGSDHPAVQH